MDWIHNKAYYKFIYIMINIFSALITISPALLVLCLPENLFWIAFILIPFTIGQIFLVAAPVLGALEAYRNASSKRGLIHEKDIYALFKENGTAQLHVGDIDTLPRYNVEIPETKYQLFTETIPVIEDSSGTERNIVRNYVRCLHCDYTFPATVIDDESFKHCPCCGNRIVRYRVPKDWYEKRKES